jgi:hypothetical protein
VKRAHEAHRLPLKRLQLAALAVGAVFLAGSFAAAYAFDNSSTSADMAKARWLQAYLAGYFYFWLVSQGCLGLTLIYQMTGGRWGYAARPFFDAGIRTLPLLALGFLPIGLGLREIYAWAQPNFFADVPHSGNRAWWLEPSFFALRSAGYLIAAMLIGYIFTIGVVARDGRMTTRLAPRLAGLSTVVLAVVFSLASVDWAMTLDTSYFSTLWGGLMAVGALLLGMCVAAAGVGLVLARLARRDDDALNIAHDLGKLLLAMLMLWAYLSFSQFLITYSGNLPEEAAWYVRRLEHGWQWVALSLVVLHFATPFALLLSRDLKRSPRFVGIVALGLAATHYVDVYWIIVPAFRPQAPLPNWLDVLVPLGIGGLWFASFLRQLERRLTPALAHWPLPGGRHA